MKTYYASLINAVVLVMVSAWAYLSAEAPSVTSLIPAFFGVALLACLPGVKADNRTAAHISAALTGLIIIALFMPLKGALSRDDVAAIFRVSVMLLSSMIAMTVFLKSFSDVRNARRLAERESGNGQA